MRRGLVWISVGCLDVCKILLFKNKGYEYVILSCDLCLFIEFKTHQKKSVSFLGSESSLLKSSLQFFIQFVTWTPIHTTLRM